MSMKTLHFSIQELVPYINWGYFYHAWGVKESQATELRTEAEEMLRMWSQEGREVLFRVRLSEANSQDDDIVLHGDCGGRIPLLRQQREPYLCLADFVPPMGMRAEKMGVFASCVPFEVKELMEETLADRLAEASAERGHEIVRRDIWGYAPEERLTPKELFGERYQGKRPAVGYPSMPDQSVNFILGRLLDLPSLGITLTENGAMMPHASTTGLMLSHPQCRHFSIGSIGEDQLQDYAQRRGMDKEHLRKFLITI